MLNDKSKLTAHNRRLAKKRVQRLNEVLYFYSSSVLADSFVLRNPPERKAQNRLAVTIKRYTTMNKALTLLLILLSLRVFGQNIPTEEAQAIVKEGKLLYKSEMASWYGTDLFLENYKDKENIGGYISYFDNEFAKCIFFSKAEKPKVIGTISFDSTYNTKTANVNLTEREFTKTENDLYEIRKFALSEINSDTLFKTYKNTNLNLIPLINGQDKKVYVLTGPQNSGVVIFGNDYFLTFDDNNKLLVKKQLHKNIIPVYYGGKEEENKKSVGAVHSHLPETGEFMTATDICTLMLYEKFAKWEQHRAWCFHHSRQAMPRIVAQ
jgi:hypothetical protein